MQPGDPEPGYGPWATRRVKAQGMSRSWAMLDGGHVSLEVVLLRSYREGLEVSRVGRG